ncbi:MAG: phosphoglycerate dehydrogenase, partial [Candidatus Omnitrophica bacterium]|nr:phosphoglycerate dehydrogenase [Candidatus Omnitrophota bacterium]
VGIEKITSRILEGGKKLKVIAKHGAGVDNIDMQTATGKGIVVTSAPGANSDAVADLTIGLFLALARKIPYADRSVKAGEWPRIVGTQFNKKTLGIIGVGQIGKKVAKRALGFDMEVLVYDVVKDNKFAEAYGVKYVSLDEILSKSDFISIHVPLIDATRNMISTREFGLMKKGAFLVNVARGGVVDEKALFDALKENKISGAAADVFTQEPAKGNPLLMLDNLIATPHMGMYTREALIETGMICVRNIIDTLQGRKPEFLNNPEVFA